MTDYDLKPLGPGAPGKGEKETIAKALFEYNYPKWKWVTEEEEAKCQPASISMKSIIREVYLKEAEAVIKALGIGVCSATLEEDK